MQDDRDSIPGKSKNIFAISAIATIKNPTCILARPEPEGGHVTLHGAGFSSACNYECKDTGLYQVQEKV